MGTSVEQPSSEVRSIKSLAFSQELSAVVAEDAKMFADDRLSIGRMETVTLL
jgi:hypothetical protein